MVSGTSLDLVASNVHGEIGARFVALLLVVSACGLQEASSDSETTSSTPSEAAPQAAESDLIECENAADLDEIVALLRSGQRTYDYQPAADLAELVDWADLSVAGSIDSAVREVSGDSSFMTLTVSDVEVLAGDGDITQFAAMALWASGQGPDPLINAVKFTGLRFVALLDQFPTAPGGYAPYVKGFVLECGDDKVPVRSLAELPPNAEDLSLSKLAELVRAVAAGPAPVEDTASSAVDGPLIRHPNRSDGEDWPAAEVRGVLQLEADCLYVFLDEINERYPVV